MLKKPQMEWDFHSQEDLDEPWAPVHPTAVDRQEQAPALPVRRAILLSIIMAFLLTVGIGVTYARQEALRGLEAVEQEVQAAVEAEQWVQHNAPIVFTDLLVYDDALPYIRWMVKYEQQLIAASSVEGAPEPVVDIQDTWFADGVAAAEVTVTLPVAPDRQPAVYRQTRFYLETEQGWMRTNPDPELWGAPLTLETEYLIWYYRRRDQAAVAETVDQIDAIYVQLQRDYGLEQSSPDGKPVIVVSADYFPMFATVYHYPENPLVVPSPSIYLVPLERTDAEILAQAAALVLLNTLRAQAVTQYGVEQGSNLLAGLSLWQIWEMELPLSEYRGDVVQWVFGPAASSTGSSMVKLPTRYEEMCAAHNEWMMKPDSVGIPLSCDGTDSEFIAKRAMLASLNLFSIDALVGPELYYQIPFTRLGKIVLLFTVIDYAVAAYGRDRLPVLVAALGQHDSWETLAPAVFGVSLGEFERGWRQHVAGLGQ